ncbi:tRNA dihydrouridine synthase DusB [Herbaspirillum sp. YR522]|uniref:tRNA dihydrouridine synthase DusB n=1 Tax=Herbaspirillum sp. YR522 TaxID=1144342 RepID=UPI00026FA2D0|nr:tRNA dihydrouridine synthase DusB [Herbaspirillum sp. YR522]EJN00932.1 putative TIM-barrel protein, nifR3 family [Herbaspirillum sp. YR522]
MNIGPYTLRNNVFVAPMAGVTDRPFRQLCKQLGAGYAVSEMAASDPRLWHSEKTSRRTNHDGEMEPKAVQIAGADPAMLAECARYNVERGAQVIDINMGCPVKKVCNSWCGSALLQDEALVVRILEAVVGAVDVPVTLKFRTGWDRANKNALRIAALAEQNGIAMLTLHGRTRADGYSGHAEYDTIAAVKAAVGIPVVANGDITTPEKARDVLRITGADAVMVGRAAQGRPWIFREIDHFLRTGTHLPAPLVTEVEQLMDEHLRAHYAFYGDYLGVRTARKHIGWYVRDLPGGEQFRQGMNRIEDCQQQLAAVRGFFAQQAALGERLQYEVATQPEPLAA